MGDSGGDVFSNIFNKVFNTAWGEATNNDSDVDAQRMQNYEMQREFAQNGIRWKVADAQAAGLHPLYALGGGGAAFAPSGIVSADGSQSVTGPFRSGQTSIERSLQDAQLKKLEGENVRDVAQASYYAALAAQARQGGSNPSPSVLGPGQSSTEIAVPGQVTIKPSEGETHAVGDVSRAAASNPLFQTFNARGGVEVLLPSAKASEALESLSESFPLLAAVVAENYKRNPDILRALIEGTKMPKAPPINPYDRHFVPDPIDYGAIPFYRGENHYRRFRR